MAPERDQLLLGLAVFLSFMAAFSWTASAQTGMAPTPSPEMAAGAAHSNRFISDAAIWSSLLFSVLALLKHY